ncbi:MAG: DUF4349 domain-containing protein [Tepidisphaera sp.]|nr:DUF4349 domain-containing protein [Tepidisphaera sp.]
MTTEPENLNVDAGEMAAGLAAASEPVSPSREIWKDALAKAGGRGAARSKWRRKWWVPAASVAAALVVLAGGALVMVPQVGRVGARWDASPGMVASQALAARSEPAELGKVAGAPGGGESFDYAMMPPVGDAKVKWHESGDSNQTIRGVAGGELDAGQPGNGEVAADRAIVRRASMEVECEDVRGAYAKATALASDALGEFIESGSLTGDGDAMRGDITLRVQASRLSLVMNQLRGLGKPTSENLSSLDVTDRLTDLDATIRNERKIEAELLDLADKRKDAPLKEVLELRDQLSQSRARIERLEAQKANAGKQVAYSAIVLTLHHKPSEEPKPEPAKSGFGEKMGEAWKNGTAGLGDALAWCVETGLARLPLLVFVGVMVFVIGILVRRAVRWSEREPTPRLG